MNKYVARIVIPIEAETPEEVQEILMGYVRNGIKSDCSVEVMQFADTEKEEDEEEQTDKNISFQELLNNLNSADMTKN